MRPADVRAIRLLPRPAPSPRRSGSGLQDGRSEPSRPWPPTPGPAASSSRSIRPRSRTSRAPRLDLDEGHQRAEPDDQVDVVAPRPEPMASMCQPRRTSSSARPPRRQCRGRGGGSVHSSTGRGKRRGSRHNLGKDGCPTCHPFIRTRTEKAAERRAWPGPSPAPPHTTHAPVCCTVCCATARVLPARRSIQSRSGDAT